MTSLALDLEGAYAFYDQPERWKPKLKEITSYQLGQRIFASHRQGRFHTQVAEDSVTAGSVVHLKISGITPLAALAIVGGRLYDGPPEAFGRIIVPFEERLDALIRIPVDAESGTYIFFGQQWEPDGRLAYPGGALIYLSKVSSVEVRSLSDEESSPWTTVFAEEMARMRKFPGIAFRGPVHDRRAWIVGSALDVWEVIEAYKVMGLERVLREGDLPEQKARLALQYYEAYSEEIDRAISENRRTEEEWRGLYPNVFTPPEQSR